MLFKIFVNIPSLVLAEIAWCIRFGIALTCLLVLLAAVIGAAALCRSREPSPAQARPSADTRLEGHRRPTLDRLLTEPGVQPANPRNDETFAASLSTGYGMRRAMMGFRSSITSISRPSSATGVTGF